jgi:hypothetical protein
MKTYESVSKIFRTGAVKIIYLTTKRLCKLPMSTQLRATWHIDSLDMVVPLYASVSRYHNYCIDGGTSPEYFEYTLVYVHDLVLKLLNWPAPLCEFKGKTFLSELLTYFAWVNKWSCIVSFCAMIDVV